MSLLTTLGTKIRTVESTTSALDDLRADLLASLPSTSSASDSASNTNSTTSTDTSTHSAADKSTTLTAAPGASTTSATPASTSATAPSSSSSSLSSSTSSTSSPVKPSTSSTLSFTSLRDALPDVDGSDDHLSWQLGLDSLTAELDNIQHDQNLQHQQLRQHHAQLIAADTTGLTPLPHNDPAAAAFHSAVIETYDRLSGGQLGLRGKAAFLSRKLKARQGRATKRAEEVYERQATKLSKGRQKAKARRKAQY